MRIKLHRAPNTNTSSPLSGLGASVAGGLAEAGGQFLGNLAMSSIENDRYKENQHENFVLAQQSQRLAASNQRTSLENAGISPAVMDGGNFQTVTPNQAPMQNKSVNMSFMGAAMQSQQLRLLAAQADQQEIVNRRLEDEDEGYDIGMKEQFEQLAEQMKKDGNDYAAGVYLNLAQAPNFFSKGSFEAWQRSATMMAHATGQVKEFYNNAFHAAVSKRQFETESVKNAEAMLPKATYDKILEEINKLDVDQIVGMTEAGKNNADIALKSAQLNEVVANVGRLLSETALNDVQAHSTYHSDFAQMVKDGNYKEAAVSLVSSIATSVIPALVSHRSPTSKTPAAPPPPKPQLSREKVHHYNKNGQYAGHSVKERSYAFPTEDNH